MIQKQTEGFGKQYLPVSPRLNVYVKLPDLLKQLAPTAFESWNNNNYPDGNDISEDYRSKRGEYRFELRDFLIQL